MPVDDFFGLSKIKSRALFPIIIGMTNFKLILKTNEIN